MKWMLVAILLLAGAAKAAPPAPAAPAQDREDRFVAVLRSAAPLKEKADACRELARVGTGRSVPVLASLLADENLSHMARFALEPIPDRSVDAALRNALSSVKGRLLAGVIHSLGVRKDPKAVRPLAHLLNSADRLVAQTAARALGSIGPAAVKPLESAMSTAAPAGRPAVCEGLFRCAEQMDSAKAAAVYDRVRKAPDLPSHIRDAALLAAIRVRGSRNTALLIETIRRGTPSQAAGALRLSSSIPGAALTTALTGLANNANLDRRLMLVRALGLRRDAGAAPTLERMARYGALDTRIAAIRSLAMMGRPTSLRLLVSLARDPIPSVANAACAALVGFPGREADAAIVASLQSSAQTPCSALMEAAAKRRVTSAAPALLDAAENPDPGVAATAFRALGELADASDVPAMVDRMLRTTSLAAAETAVTAVCSRQTEPAACAPAILAGLTKASGDAKLALLRTAAAVGGPDSLAAIRAASTEQRGAARETAVRALCEWPTADALQDVERIAGTATDRTEKILALRGSLRLIPLQPIDDAQKAKQLGDLLPILDRRDEQVLALGALGGLSSAEALTAVTPYLDRPDLAAEAGIALVAIAERIVAGHPDEVAAAIDQFRTNDSQLAGRAAKLKERVSAALADGTENGFVAIFNGRDLSGWSGKPGWWTVVDGALTAESTPEKPCKECNYLIWRGGQPADFDLRAEFKLSAAGNSGIQIRSEERPDWDTFGYQADMTGDGELVGFVYHHSRGLIAGRGERATFAADGTKSAESIGDAAALLKHFRPGEWNAYRVVCRGPNISLYVNGALMCQITDRHATQAARRGIIALQMHPGPPMKVQFRNIRLKELK